MGFYRIPRTKGQQYGNRFLVMSSSWLLQQHSLMLRYVEYSKALKEGIDQE